MTLSTEVTRNEYTLTTGQTELDVTFRFFSDSDLVVTRTDSAGENPATLTLSTDYSVEGTNVATGGTVTLVTAGVAGEILVIERVIPVTQTYVFRNASDFNRSSFETALDKIVAMIQQLVTSVSRSLHLSTATPDDYDTELPTPVEGALLAWGADGITNAYSASASLSTALSNSSDVEQGDALVTTKQPITSAVARSLHSKILDSVSLMDFLTTAQVSDVRAGTLAQDVSVAVATAIASGARFLYVPDGDYALATAFSATLTDDLYFFGPGRFKYTGAQNAVPIMIVSCSGHKFEMSGLEFDGNSLCCGGPRIDNNSDTFTTAIIENCHFHDFYMGTAASWNHGYYIRGAFDLVTLRGNKTKNITRAAGTGTSGTYATSGGNVTQAAGSVTRYAKRCVHLGNHYENILGGDLYDAVGNVDYDGFAYFTPDPTNFDNSDDSLKCYPDASIYSAGNTYRNCRGRAIKVQGIADIDDETIIRDADYTINPASADIDLQWGIGSVKNIQFIYRDYLVSATVTSPIQTALNCVSVYTGADYDIAHAGASISGLRIFNSIKAGVGNDINAILGATFGAEPQAQRKPMISLSDVVVNRGAIKWIVNTNFAAGGYCLLRLSDIAVDSIVTAAIGSNGTSENCELLATGVINWDGVVTPANAVRWVRSSADDGDKAWSGKMTGFGNRGFLESFASGSSYVQGPMLEGAALSGASGINGAGASVQSLYLADDASGSFTARGFTANTGMFAVVTNGAYTGNGLITAASAALYSLTPEASDLSLSTGGTNPDTDGKLNIWIADGVIKIKNRLGAARLISILFFG